jgi:hypothetical protein
MEEKAALNLKETLCINPGYIKIYLISNSQVTTTSFPTYAQKLLR